MRWDVRADIRFATSEQQIAAWQRCFNEYVEAQTRHDTQAMYAAALEARRWARPMWFWEVY